MSEPRTMPVVAATADGTRHRPTLRKKLVFACVPLVLLALFAEVVIRLVRAPLHFGSFRELRTDLFKRNYPAQLDPVLGYVPKPGFASRDNHWRTQVSIDADGLRRNGDGTPPAGDRVIVTVGDSFTFGDEVDDDASWPAQLERELQRPVKNGGVFGYSFAQAVLRAEQLLERFACSAVVVSFIPDDLTRSEFRRRYTALPVFALVGDGVELRNVPLDHAPPPADTARAWKDLLGCSALVDGILANVAPKWWYENDKQVPEPELVGKGHELAKRLLVRLQQRCAAHGARLLVILQGESANPLALEVLTSAAAAGIDTLDLTARYRERLAADPSLRQKWFRGHMTREGNGWVAREVAAVLR